MLTMAKIDWGHVYLLGYEGFNGRMYLTTWGGEGNEIEVAVTGGGNEYIPLWNDAVPDGMELHPIPEGTDARTYAKEIGGRYAFGWLVETQIERELP